MEFLKIQMQVAGRSRYKMRNKVCKDLRIHQLFCEIFSIEFRFSLQLVIKWHWQRCFPLSFAKCFKKTFFSYWATAFAPTLCSLCYILFLTFSWLPAPPILTKHCSKRSFFWLEKNWVARKHGKFLRKKDNFQNSMMLIFHLNRWYPHL